MFKRISNKTYEKINALGYDVVVSKHDGILALHISELNGNKNLVSFKVSPYWMTVEIEKYELSFVLYEEMKHIIKGFILENNNDLINLVTVIENYMELNDLKVI